MRNHYSQDIIKEAKRLINAFEEYDAQFWNRAIDDEDVRNLYFITAKMASLLNDMMSALQGALNTIAYYEGKTMYYCDKCGAKCVGED